MRPQHQEGVGAEIARLRRERGWSQRELAKVLALDQSAVSRIEAGQRGVSAAELQRFADIFRVSADTLLGAFAGEPATERTWSGSGTDRVRTDHWVWRASPGEHDLLGAISRARSEADTGEVPGAEQSSAPAALPAASEPGDSQAHGFAAAEPPGSEPGAAAGPQDAVERRWPSRRPAASAAPPATTPHGDTGGEWAAGIAAVVRDWFELRRLAGEPDTAQLWSTGQTADGRPAQAARPWQPAIPPPGSGDVLYDRVARFWRSELHVEPDDGPLPDLVPLLEDGLGVQVIVARIRALTTLSTDLTDPVSDPRPVAATVASDGVPFVFVNAGRPVVLQRFALVHAFAHLVLGHGDVLDESIGWSRANPREAAANDFAEEFLAPVRAVERWYGRRAASPRSPSLDTLLELANAFGISAWAALFRSRAAGRLNPKQFAALRGQMRGLEWQLLPRQAFLGGLKDTLAHLTPAEVLPVGGFGPPAVLRVPARMRTWALAALRAGRLSLEDAAAMVHLRPSALAEQLERLGLE